MQCIAPHLFGIGVWVVSVWQQNNLDGHAFGKKHVDAAQGGPNACCIPIENHRHILGESADQMNLTRGQCSPAGGHHVFHTCLVHRHDVGVPLHQKTPLLLDNRRLGQVHAVEDLGLVVQQALWRVEVLGNLFLGAEGPSAKANHTARDISDREHDTAFEKVPQRAVVALLAKASLHQLFCRITSRLTCLGHGVPRIRAVANQKGVQHIVSESPLHEVAATNGFSCIGLLHLLCEPLLRPSDHIAQALLGCGRRDFFWGRRLLLHLNVVASGQHPKRFGIIDLLQLHEKGDQASAFAAGKALENALGGQDVKRRRLLVRERT